MATSVPVRACACVRVIKVSHPANSPWYHVICPSKWMERTVQLKKNVFSMWFHARPDSIWEDTSRNRILCHTLDKLVGLRATSSLWAKLSLWGGHSRPFIGGKVPWSNSQPSTAKNAPLYKKPLHIRSHFEPHPTPLPFKSDEIFFFSRSKCRAWVVLCDKWRINIRMLFQTRKKEKPKPPSGTVHATC